MCEPTIWIAIGATVLAGAYTADAQNKQGKAAAKQSEEDSKVMLQQASQAKEIGNIEEERHLKRVRQMISSQRTAAAANGIDTNFGSPLDLQAETAGLGAADAQQIRTNALREAWGFKVGSVNSLNRASAARTGGRNAAIGTLLTTAASAASIYSAGSGSQMKTKKIPGLGDYNNSGYAANIA